MGRLWSELATVTRGNRTLSLPAGFDPAESRLYLAVGSDVQVGDQVSLRSGSIVRRVIEAPQTWGLGVVAQLQDAPTDLLDVGQLERKTGNIVWDPDLNTETDEWAQIWSGACLVEPVQSAAGDLVVGQQATQVQPYTVTFALSLTDVRGGDRFTATASHDPGLVGRSLIVTRVEAGSLLTNRIVSAKEEQP